MAKKRAAKASTDIVIWAPKQKVQVFYVKTAFQVYRPTRNADAALGMAGALVSQGIRTEIVTAYVPEWLIG